MIGLGGLEKVGIKKDQAPSTLLHIFQLPFAGVKIHWSHDLTILKVASSFRRLKRTLGVGP